MINVLAYILKTLNFMRLINLNCSLTQVILFLITHARSDKSVETEKVKRTLYLPTNFNKSEKKISYYKLEQTETVLTKSGVKIVPKYLEDKSHVFKLF